MPAKKRKLNSDDPSITEANDADEASSSKAVAQNPSEKSSPTTEDLTIPFNDKIITCRQYNPQSSQKQSSSSPSLIFTHGAGGGISNPATSEFASGFARLHPLLSFEGATESAIAHKILPRHHRPHKVVSRPWRPQYGRSSSGHRCE